jgi:hypothetical protein
MLPHVFSERQEARVPVDWPPPVSFQMKIAPTLLSDSDVVNIYNLARGKEGWDDVYSEPLTQPQFLRAIYHVTEWVST